jgi:hypothetical protein
MKLKLTLTLAALLCFAGYSPAQTITNATKLDDIIGELGGMTNFAVEPYATYAPKAPEKWGGGVLLAYDVNPQDSLQVGIALGLDWLGSFSLVSGNVSLSAPFHPMPSTLKTLTISPFVLVGIATPYSGDGHFNGTAATVEDIGAYLRFGHAFGGQFNIGACYGQWTGVGPYDVKRYHMFAGWQHGF